MLISLSFCVILWLSLLGKLPQLPPPWQGFDALAKLLHKQFNLPLGYQQLLTVSVIVIGYSIITHIIALPWMLELYLLGIASQARFSSNNTIIIASAIFTFVHGTGVLIWLLLSYAHQSEQKSWSKTLINLIEFIPWILWSLCLDFTRSLQQLNTLENWQLNTPRKLATNLAQSKQSHYISQRKHIWLSIVSVILLISY